MRVALVVESFEPGRGGVENAAWQVAHGLAKAGDEVVVVARRGRGAPGIEQLRVRAPEAWQPLRVWLFDRGAARATRRGGFDVVYSLARTRHQDVLRAGGGSHADYLRQRHGRLGAGLRRLSPRHATLLALERGGFRAPAQWLHFGSRWLRDQVLRRHPIERARTAVIPNGVDLARFHPRHRAGAGARGGSRPPVWLFAGSGFARKGLDTALHALARGRGGAELWVAGRDAPARWRRLAARLGVAGRVRFLGQQADMPALYAASDALLLPTRYDAFANACLEAAASGLPVLTSSSNGAAEWLAPAGLAAPAAGDVDGFARELERLAEPALRVELGARARRAAEACGWERHIPRLRDLFLRARR